MRIAVDIDDCLFAWSDAAHAAAERAGITNGAVITQWGFHEDYGVTAAELWAVLLDAYRSGMLHGDPYPGVRDDLGRLRLAGHTIHLVTSRGFEVSKKFKDMAPFVREDTAHWVAKHIPHDSLTFTQDKAVVRADVAIDDSLANCQVMRAAGTTAYLMSRPHNATADWPLCVASLGDFVDVVLGMTAEAVI